MKDYEKTWYERKKKDIRDSAYYRAIRNYILRTYGENENIPLDFSGQLRILAQISIQERAPYGMGDCFDQLIIDLINEGIIRHEYILGREWYVKLTEKEAETSNKEEIDTNGKKAHISRRKKKEMKKNQKKDEIKQTQLYKEVYDFIKEALKSGKLFVKFDQEIAKRSFLENKKDRELDASDVNLCIQEAIKQLEREHVISYHGMHHMRFPIYRVNSAEYIKEKLEEERAEAEEWEEPLVSEEELDRLRQIEQEGNEH